MYRVIFLVGILVLCFSAWAVADPDDTVWTRTYGGSERDWGYSIKQTTDGGYIIAGYTSSFGAVDKDVYLVKVDAFGDTLWTQTYGDGSRNEAFSVLQTDDGGYLFGCRNMGTLMKTDPLGDTTWTLDHDGVWAWDIQHTSDGGYIVAGNYYPYDGSLIKIDSLGGVTWSIEISDPVHILFSVQETYDCGYIAAGIKTDPSNHRYDWYIVRVDSLGNIVWERQYGLDGDEYAKSIIRTNDGKYVICGFTRTFSEDDADFWMMKLDDNGDSLWTRTYGGSEHEYGCSVKQTLDGGYIVVGTTRSFGMGVRDYYVIKTDAFGDTLWTSTYGGTADEEATSVLQIDDGRYVIIGSSNSFGAGDYDIYLVKIEGNPPRTWHISIDGNNETGDGSEENPFATIQHGIDMANNGDTVLVHSGTYVENINFNGHNIVLGSLFLTTGDTSYISQTVINGNHAGSVITLNNGENNTAQVIGLSICNGVSSIGGGGIYCDNTGPTISHNRFTGNSTVNRGGGIYCLTSSPTISYNIFTGNYGGSGGGIAIFGEASAGCISHNIVDGNSATYWGGGILLGDSDIIIADNIISNNSVINLGGGIACLGHSPIIPYMLTQLVPEAVFYVITILIQ